MKNKSFLSLFLAPLLFIYSVIVFSSDTGKLLDYEGSSIRDGTSGEYLYLPDFPSTKEVIVDKKNSIAIVDSGVAEDHPQLKDYIVNQIDFTGEGLYDKLGHGTIVSLIYIRGLAQSSAFGLTNVGSSIVSVKVADQNGSIKKEAMINAIKWIGKNNISLANLSLGFEGNIEDHKDLCDAIVKQDSVLFVAAAGNSGPDVLSFPAACDADNLISVGATKNGRVAEYSGQGDVYVERSVVLLDKKMILYRDANSLSKQGLLAKALLKYDEVISIFPMAEAHFEKGIIYIHSKNYNKAFNELEKALRVNPDFPEALEQVGLIHHLLGNNNKALSFLEEALYLAPDNQRIIGNIKKVKMMIKSEKDANKSLKQDK